MRNNTNCVHQLFTKLSILILFIFILGGCSGTRILKTQEMLIDKSEVFENEQLLKNNPVNFIITTVPNKKVFGIPFGKILYESAHPDPKLKFQDWLQKKEKRTLRLNKWLSKKQVNALENYGVLFNDWLKKTGEVPAVLDSTEIKTSENRIIQYYKNLGHFDIEVTVDTVQTAPKKVTLKYLILPKNKYMIDSVTSLIRSADIDSVYQKHIEKQLIKKGTPFEIKKFEEERERLILLFRNNGIYNFQQNSIQFTAAIDSTGLDKKIPINIQIDNIQQRINDSLKEIPYTVSRIKKVEVYIDNLKNQSRFDQFTDTLNYAGITIFSKGKLKYRPKAIASGIAIKKDSAYSDENRNISYRYFTSLKNFKYPSINYTPIPGEKDALKASLFLTPKERFSLGFDLDFSHSNIQDFGIGLGGGLGIRNVFRGAELLELNIKNTVGSSRDIAQSGDQFFNIFELGADLKLSLPRLLIPFFEKELIPKSMSPKTEIIVGSSFQENIGLDKQFFKGTYQFDWQPNGKKRIQFKWIDLEFINNRNLNNYFNVYKNSYDRLNSIAQNFNTQQDWFDENNNLSIPEGTSNFISSVLNNDTLLSIEDNEYKTINTVKERQDRLTANNLILGSSFSINFNSQESIFDESFYQIRWKLDWVGTILNQFLTRLNSEQNEDGQNVLAGVSPSQYIKTEFDFIKHWKLGREQVIAFHAFTGVAIPFGNSTNMPFARSFFSGGSNDNRAWKAYKLGPGSSSNINEFNEANLKLTFNFEYRFPLAGPLKGGLFIDTGNIWNIWDDVDDSAMKFEGLQDLSEIAVGSGIGLRYDFDFLVFRFDTGFKTYNPALPEGERWLSEYKLKNAVFNIGINYPF
ncbi:outer membrane protein assembly factor [Flavobacteriaceae bacterium]|nr:outer membrane protein assembly factor [Flavobacteriaceae bacterium]